jgi:hypothetical protein
VRLLLRAGLVAAALLPGGVLLAQAGPVLDLVVLQTSANPLAVARSSVAGRVTSARVIRSDDCLDMKPGLFVLAARAGGTVPAVAGAYRRRCQARPDSLAARGISAVDPSFAALREDPASFEPGDAVSSIKSGLLLRPWLTNAPDDPREGLRTAVEDLSGGTRRVLARDCTAPEVARGGGHVAVACAISQAAEVPIYRTDVFRAGSATPVRQVARCRRPRLAAGTLTCAGQGPDGSETGDRSVKL